MGGWLTTGGGSAFTPASGDYQASWVLNDSDVGGTYVNEALNALAAASGDGHTHANKAQLDLITDGDHDVRTDNPHATDLSNLGNGSLAELNSLLTDATLDDSGNSRTPTAHASSHYDGGTDEITVQNLGSAATPSGQVLQADGAGGLLFDTVAAGGGDVTGATLYGYIGGLSLKNAADADHDITVASGVCRDSTNSVFIATDALTKRIDAAWSLGDNAGGLFTGSVAANNTYHFFVAASGDTVDAGFDVDPAGSNIPGGFTYFRRLGSVRTDDSANINGFRQFGNDFLLNEWTTDYNSTNPGTSLLTHSLTVPSGIEVAPIFTVYAQDVSPSGQTLFSITGPDQSTIDPTASGLYRIGPASEYLNASIDGGILTSNGEVRTHQSQSTSDHTLKVFTRGWTDNRGTVNAGNVNSVTSVYGRTGTVSAASGDYNTDQITNQSNITGNSVTAALNDIDANRAMVLLSTVTASGDATIDFTGLTDDYSLYKFEIINAAPDTDDVYPQLRVSVGSSFQSGGSDYAWSYSTQAASADDQSASSVRMQGGVGSAAGEGCSFNIHLSDPAGNTLYQHILFTGLRTDDVGEVKETIGVGAYLTSAAVDGIQFFFSSGNVESGTFKLYGVK